MVENSDFCQKFIFENIQFLRIFSLGMKIPNKREFRLIENRSNRQLEIFSIFRLIEKMLSIRRKYVDCYLRI